MHNRAILRFDLDQVFARPEQQEEIAKGIRMSHMDKLKTSIVLLVVFACQFQSASAQSASAQNISWTHSPEQAVQWANQSGRMIIVSVGASWCHYCKKMDRDVWRNPTVARTIATEYVPLKLTDNRHRELIESMQVSGYPATLIFTPDRRLVARMDGYVGPEKVLQTMHTLRASIPSTPQISRSVNPRL
ncbi:thioredoxin family protein [Novipirellula sp. SH528]|uniref:thioredoxin family protein n=1 Tax=Novipirellula sp. SH528 TaxID=3454466 RepID=UPI003F9F0EB9